MNIIRQHRILSTLAGLGLLLGIVVNAPGVMAQRVIDVTPGVNSSMVSPDTSISGVFETSDGSLVQPGSVTIYLNGQNVTTNSTVTRSFFSYRPTSPLSPGSYTVRVDYQSTQGQRRSVSWMFTVQSQAALEISQVTHNAVEGIGRGGTLLVTKWDPRGASFGLVG